jgi:hypothetical protein
MPAVELSRLRAQIEGLTGHFNDPAAFQIALRNLLDVHANRAYRAGQAVQAQPLLPSYRVAPLVTRQLELELGKLCLDRPVQALALVEELWHDPSLEPRLLAATLIGVIPAEHGEAVIQKLRAWSQPNQNFRILEALFRNGMAGLRRSNPGLLLNLLDEWLSSARTDVQLMGIRATIPLIEDEQFENLPPVFRMLSPVIQNIPAALQVDLNILFEVMVRRAPTEAAYFFHQVLALSTSPGTARLIRRCLPLFTGAQQSSLRAALQSAKG